MSSFKNHMMGARGPRLIRASVHRVLSAAWALGFLAWGTSCQSGSSGTANAAEVSAVTVHPVVDLGKAPVSGEVREGEVLALCTVRETASGVVHRLEFLFNPDLGVYEVDHLSIGSDLRESFRSYFARGKLMKSRIALDFQESVTGMKFAELVADGRGENGLLLGKVTFTQLQPMEQDNAECSVKF